MMRVINGLNQCFATTINRRLPYYTCFYCSFSTQNERYNLLNAASDIIELNKNWKSLHVPYKYPLFREYCKMIQMLSKFQKFSEISVVYEQLLNHISFPPQNIKKWRDFDISIHPMNVTQIMRCAKIANDWNTMYQFMQIYIKNDWKFNKVSARFALECCWRYKDETNDINDTGIEETVTNIWNNLIINNIPDEYCFIHLLLNIKKQFTNINKINSLLLQILNDINKSFPSQTMTNKSLYMVIFDEMLQISDKHNLNDITIKIAQQILQPIGSNLFLSFSNSDVIQYIRYGKIPLRLIVKLLHFYDTTTNIEGTLQLFEIMKRFRSLSLQNMNAINDNDNDNNVLLKYWEHEIFNDDILPIFMKIIYDYLFAHSMNDMTDLLLTRYINNAEIICKYINYTINTPKASLYLCGIYYLSSSINTANILTMNVINKIFLNTSQENNEYLLKQWENGQFVLNLSTSLNIANIMYIPLILSSLIYYAKTIPKQDKALKSIKIKLDIDKLDEFEKLFEYLALNYAPKIEYEIIGKIPNWNLVIELHLNSLLKWCEYHNIICFQDIDKQNMLNTTCLQLLPQIITIDKQKNNIQSRKQLFEDINTRVFQ